MTRSLTARLAYGVSLTIIALFVTAGVSRAETPPDAVFDFPAGFACPDFPLHLEIRGFVQVNKEFKAKNGVVRLLMAGKGSALLFENGPPSGPFTAALSLTPNGSVAHVTTYPDGSQTWMTNGHNVLILFPTDVGGPATTLTVGRMIFTVDPAGIFEVQEVSGNTTDICAALS